MGGKQSLWGKLKGAVQELAGDVVTLCSHPVYLSTVAGQTLYTGDLPLSYSPIRLAAVTPRYLTQPTPSATEVCHCWCGVLAGVQKGVEQSGLKVMTSMTVLCSVHWSAGLSRPEGGQGRVLNQRGDSGPDLWRCHSFDWGVRHAGRRHSAGQTRLYHAQWADALCTWHGCWVSLVPVVRTDLKVVLCLSSM